MESEKRRNFDIEAAKWDSNPGRVKLANDVADAIIRVANLRPDMEVLDFGCGTGLVTLRLCPFVKSIVGADSSSGMLEALQVKVKHQQLTNVYTQLVDFEEGQKVTGTFNLVVSSMTAHHVPETPALVRMWYDLLNPGGHVCFADLDTEDGTFHSDNTGVFHFGFDREKLKLLLSDTGFTDISDITAATVVRDVEGVGKKEFPVFLIEAKRRK